MMMVDWLDDTSNSGILGFDADFPVSAVSALRVSQDV